MAMSEHLSREQILRRLDGELPPTDIRKVSAHLQACHSCQAELDLLKEHLAALTTRGAGPAAARTVASTDVGSIKREARARAIPFWKARCPEVLRFRLAIPVWLRP
jgi:anti-sigma factor RsiW